MLRSRRFGRREREPFSVNASFAVTVSLVAFANAPLIAKSLAFTVHELPTAPSNVSDPVP
ncbi:hypothetical protein WK59_13435 [Burkholderia ubonensis]|nr:hypothetical protein WK59_13435 [Burkholderia ubonensis]KVU10318.1 hypothetical protein WK62_05785 [Burkholderia ubonensis]